MGLTVIEPLRAGWGSLYDGEIAYKGQGDFVAPFATTLETVSQS